jgi:stage II sporulation protein D
VPLRLCFFLLAFLGLSLAQNDLILRVLLNESPQAQIAVGSHRRITGYGESDAPASTLNLRAEGNEILLGGENVGPWLELSGEGFAMNGRSYRGNFLGIAQNGKLLLINRVYLEDYLLGVVPSEIPGNFPPAVMQAQAILARTFAIFKLNPSGFYDICADERCQVYQGRGVETSAHSGAVYATRGLIVSYDNRPITAVYHADSGGHTANSEEVWGKAVPYLVAQPDPYSQSPKGTWNQTLSPAAVARSLGNMGMSVGTVQSIETLFYTSSGRPARLRIVGSGKSLTLSATETTKLLRALGLPSTRVQLSGWQVTGQGMGHGVGMSQWGAKGFAAQGWDYRQILGYYYPGTFLAGFDVITGIQDQLIALGYRRGVLAAFGFGMDVSK